MQQKAPAFTKALKPRSRPATERKPKTRRAGELKPAHTTLFPSRFVEVLHIQDLKQQLSYPPEVQSSVCPSFPAGWVCRHSAVPQAWRAGLEHVWHSIMAWSYTPMPLLPFWNTKRNNTPMRVQFMSTPQPLWSAEADVFWDKEGDAQIPSPQIPGL